MNSEEFRKKINYISLYDEQLPFGRPLAKNIKFEKSPLRHLHLVVDVNSNRVCAVSVFSQTANLLNQNYDSTFVKHSANMIDSFEVTFNSQKPYVCTYMNMEYSLTKDDFDFDTLYFHHLFIEKAAALDLLNNRVNAYRRSVLNGLFLQETVYYYKVEEAKEYLRLYDIDKDVDLLNFQFLRDYAEINNSSLYDAAREILIQNKIYKTRLSNTENLRLKYQRLIVDCKEIEKIKSITNQFLCDGELYGRF